MIIFKFLIMLIGILVSAALIATLICIGIKKTIFYILDGISEILNNVDEECENGKEEK